MKRFLYLLISLIALSSCGVLKNYPLEQEYNEVWKGKTYNEIVMSFGAPVLLDGLTFCMEVFEHFGRFKAKTNSI